MPLPFFQRISDALTGGLYSRARNFVGLATSPRFGGGRFVASSKYGSLSQQDINNAYSAAETEHAQQLYENNAREANRIADERATVAFERQKYLQDMAMAFNADEAQKARDYDERMSNTAYQRAMADMKAAGLNPILAYSQGGAASTGGQAASVGVSSAVQAETFMPDVARQYIDTQSDSALKRAYVQTVGQLLSTFVNSAATVVRRS